MPLDPDVKSRLRDRVSTANKANVADVVAEVTAAREGLAEDDKDYARLGSWLEDLAVIQGGGVPGKYCGRGAGRGRRPPLPALSPRRARRRPGASRSRGR